MTARPEGVTQPAEQLRYAALLDAGTRVGLLALVLGFAAYVTGLVASHVPLEQLPQLWSHPVGQYLAETGTPTGWGWVALLPRADILGLAGIALLTGVSLLCLLALLPLYAARGDRAFVLICLAEMAVVLLAASGWISGGHG